MLVNQVHTHTRERTFFNHAPSVQTVSLGKIVDFNNKKNSFSQVNVKFQSF